MAFTAAPRVSSLTRPTPADLQGDVRDVFRVVQAAVQAGSLPLAAQIRNMEAGIKELEFKWGDLISPSDWKFVRNRCHTYIQFKGDVHDGFGDLLGGHGREDERGHRV